MMEFANATDLVRRLRVPSPSFGGRTDLETEAAGVIESLVFQLSARIGVATAEKAAEVGAAP